MYLVIYSNKMNYEANKREQTGTLQDFSDLVLIFNLLLCGGNMCDRVGAHVKGYTQLIDKISLTEAH